MYLEGFEETMETVKKQRRRKEGMRVVNGPRERTEKKKNKVKKGQKKIR